MYFVPDDSILTNVTQQTGIETAKTDLRNVIIELAHSIKDSTDAHRKERLLMLVKSMSLLQQFFDQMQRHRHPTAVLS